MTVSWRRSALAERHIALGSSLEDWNGMGTAWTYARRCCRRPAPARMCC
jgi:aminomethyltransferase